MEFFAGAVFGSAVTLAGMGLLLASVAAWVGLQWLRGYVRQP